MSNTHTCQRGGRTFAVAAGGPGSAPGPDQSAKVDQRQPNRDSQSVQFFRRATASQGEELRNWGTEVLGERKYWHTNSSEASGAQTSQPFSKDQPRSLPHRRKTVKKILDLHYDMVSGQRRKLSPLEADDSLRFSSAAEALQQQRRPHGVFQEENKKRAFSDTNYGTCGYKKRQKREKEKDGEQKRPRLYC